MRILLLDPQFAHYKRKFSPSKEEMDPSCYNCRRYWHRLDVLESDSINIDQNIQISTQPTTIDHQIDIPIEEIEYNDIQIPQ